MKLKRKKDKPEGRECVELDGGWGRNMAEEEFRTKLAPRRRKWEASHFSVLFNDLLYLSRDNLSGAKKTGRGRGEERREI